MALEAKNWIRQKFGTTFTIAGNKQHVTTLPKTNKEEESCRNELNDHIVDRSKVITINENNQPKQKTHLEIATGKEVDNQKVEKKVSVQKIK